MGVYVCPFHSFYINFSCQPIPLFVYKYYLGCPMCVYKYYHVCPFCLYKYSYVCPVCVHKYSLVCPVYIHKYSLVCPVYIHKYSLVCPVCGGESVANMNVIHILVGFSEIEKQMTLTMNKKYSSTLAKGTIQGKILH